MPPSFCIISSNRISETLEKTLVGSSPGRHNGPLLEDQDLKWSASHDGLEGFPHGRLRADLPTITCSPSIRALRRPKITLRHIYCVSRLDGTRGLTEHG